MTWNEAVKEGFIQALLDGKTLQKILLVNGTWIDLEKSFFNLEHHRPDEIRIKPEKKRVPLTEDDLPPEFWIRFSSGGWKKPQEIFAGGLATNGMIYGWRELKEKDLVWSTDRKTEHPFWKEVEG